MKKSVLLIVTLCIVTAALAKTAKGQLSPDGRLRLEAKAGTFALYCEEQLAVEIAELPMGKLTFVRHLTEDYTMQAGKRLHCTNEANEYEMKLPNARLVFRLYNDGLAFRYEDAARLRPEERHVGAYIIPDYTRRWLMKWTDSYEGFFPLATQSQDGRWGYPALIEPADGLFALLTEANIERSQSASCLYSEGERYRIVPADTIAMARTPWQLAIVGSLSTVVESTLVTDVSNPCALSDTSWIKPGVVSWIYWAHNHGSNDYNIIRKYVDMAATLQLPYVLIDAEWDEMKDGKTIEDAVAYANSRGVKPLIWYNSSVGWVNGAPGPKYRLNKPEDREREFDWCERIGVAGVKIDFFSGDTQENMDYCIDLLECAARHRLLVNFHGATIPRGWQRTYPNLLTTEGVYGAEWYNNVPTFTDRAARHNAMLPFTRNVVGPMDYTPCTFSDSQHPHITTYAHELALTVLFESGLQHLADRPESYLAQPAAVQRFFTELPAAWDDTRLLSGVPGEMVVMARRSGAHWFIAGINGTDDAQTINVPVGCLPSSLRIAAAYFDAPGQSRQWDIRTNPEMTLSAAIPCQPRGGFVLVLK